MVHRDEPQWASTWAPDAVWELGQDRRVEGHEAIVQLWNGTMDGCSAAVQNALNGTTDLDESAGTGAGRWYVLEHWARADGSRGMRLAHYDDSYVRLDGAWYFASRELVINYAGPPDLSAQFAIARS